MSFFSSAKKIFVLGFIFVILLVIPLTVYVLQQQQETRSKAAPSTSLSFSPQTKSLTVEETVKLDIIVDPAAGNTSSNQVSFVKLTINYDPSKLTKTDEGLEPNLAAFPSLLEEATYNETTNPASASITLSVGADPTKVVTSRTKVASVTFKAKAATDSNGTKIVFNNDKTQAYSIAESDEVNENVLLSSLSPATITIASAATLSPSPTPTNSPSSAPPAPTPTSLPGQAANKAPVCIGLNLDRSSRGVIPYPITLTAIGNDEDGTINKVSFNFGDSPLEDVTQTGGIGTKTVNVQKSHTYNAPGVYKASAILTDNNGAISIASEACTQTITVTTSASNQTPTDAIEQPITPGVDELPPTGPENLMLKIGGAAAAISIIGAILLFAL